MKVCIYDCEWASKTGEFYNYKTLKIASYHKQQGDEVRLIYPNEVTTNYNKLYIVKELSHSEMPPAIYFEDPQASLYGEALRHFTDFQEFDTKFAAMRPDYLLFPSPQKVKQRAQFVQRSVGIFNLVKYQPFENSFEGAKHTVVCDDDLWSTNNVDFLIEYLTDLAQYKNLYFLYPIKLKIILEDYRVRRAFLNLHFSSTTKIVLENNYGSSYEQAKTLIDFIKNWLPKRTFKPLKFKSILYNHWGKPENALEDYIRCLKIMTYAQQNKLRINFIFPRKLIRVTTYWAYFEVFQYWTKYPYSSLCEMLLGGTAAKLHISIQDIFWDSSTWFTYRVKLFMYMLIKYNQLMEQYAFNTWGGDRTIYKYDIDYLKQELKRYENIIL